MCSTKIGLYNHYFNPEDDTFRTIVKLWPSLAYVPVEAVSDVAAELSTHTLSIFQILIEFVVYFFDTWVGPPGAEGGRFKKSFWNVRKR